MLKNWMVNSPRLKGVEPAEMDTYTLLSIANELVRIPELDGFTVDPEQGMRWTDFDREFVRFWNPRTNDADALDLAVRAGLFSSQPKYLAYFLPRLHELQMSGVEPHAATRNAIVFAVVDRARDERDDEI